MQKLINHTSILEDNWVFLESIETDVPAGNVIIPGSYWLENKESLAKREDVGIWLDSDAEPELFIKTVDNLPLIAINFPAFANGRGYSLARLVKERTEFKGELRAIGDVLLDQIYFMKRCGFDSFLLKDGLSAEKALEYLATFSDPYQLAFDQPNPLFRRKAN
jgi:uncharacterized protein (DUF934 family)